MTVLKRLLQRELPEPVRKEIVRRLFAEHVTIDASSWRSAFFSLDNCCNCGCTCDLYTSTVDSHNPARDNAPRPPDGPLLKIFGSEPKHEWPYFYQRAELERELKHWDAVALLGDEVMKQGYKPSDPSEWFPFIDGYARTHRYRTAADISNSVLEDCPDAMVPLSSLWLRIEREDPQNSAELSGALRAWRQTYASRLAIGCVADEPQHSLSFRTPDARRYGAGVSALASGCTFYRRALVGH